VAAVPDNESTSLHFFEIATDAVAGH